MAFNDLSFVFLFFPVVLLAHWVVPGMFKNAARQHLQRYRSQQLR